MRFAYLTRIACRPDKLKRIRQEVLNNCNVIIPSCSVMLAALFAGRAAAHHHRYLLSGLRAKRCGTRCQSVDPFGFSSQFVGPDNFVTLFHDSYYLDAFWTTIKFSTFVTGQRFAGIAVLRSAGEYIVRGSRFYQTLMLLPYAVVPPLPPYCGSFCLTPVAG